MKPPIKWIARYDDDLYRNYDYGEIDRPTWLPWFDRFAYVDWDTDRAVYALVGLHWLLRLWRRWSKYRWALERLGHRYGLYRHEEGDYWRFGKWRMPA